MTKTKSNKREEWEREFDKKFAFIKVKDCDVFPDTKTIKFSLDFWDVIKIFIRSEKQNSFNEGRREWEQKFMEEMFYVLEYIGDDQERECAKNRFETLIRPLLKQEKIAKWQPRCFGESKVKLDRDLFCGCGMSIGHIDWNPEYHKACQYGYKTHFIDMFKSKILKRKCTKCDRYFGIDEKHTVDYPTHCAECAANMEL